MNFHWNDLPTSMQVTLIAVAVLSLALLVTALVSWARTPAERMSLPKVAWLLIILLVSNGIGPIAWFVAGRRAAKIENPVVTEWADQQQHAVDVLFGSKK